MPLRFGLYHTHFNCRRCATAWTQGDSIAATIATATNANTAVVAAAVGIAGGRHIAGAADTRIGRYGRGWCSE